LDNSSGSGRKNLISSCASGEAPAELQVLPLARLARVVFFPMPDYREISAIMLSSTRWLSAPRLSSTRHGHGLAIAMEFAERNGGILTVETSHHGTTFILKPPSFYAGQRV
jgi:hypothetical protein